MNLPTCNPALADLETALALALPESLPALPPAYMKKTIENTLKIRLTRSNFACV